MSHSESKHDINDPTFPACCVLPCCACHIKASMLCVYVMSAVTSVLFVTPWLFHSDVLPLFFVILAVLNTSVMVIGCVCGIVALRNENACLSVPFWLAQCLNIVVALAEIGLFVYIIAMPESVQNRYRRQYVNRYKDDIDPPTFETYRTMNQLRFGFYISRDVAAICLSLWFLVGAYRLYHHFTQKAVIGAPPTSMMGHPLLAVVEPGE